MKCEAEANASKEHPWRKQWERDMKRLQLFDESAWVVDLAVKEPYKLWKEQNAQGAFITFDLRQLRSAERGMDKPPPEWRGTLGEAEERGIENGDVGYYAQMVAYAEKNLIAK